MHVCNIPEIAMPIIISWYKVAAYNEVVKAGVLGCDLITGFVLKLAK